MKKLFVLYCLVALTLSIGLFGCNYQNIEERSENEVAIQLSTEQMEDERTENQTDFAEGDLRVMFEELNNEAIKDFMYADYNKDGIHEAFVLTQGANYKLWYMTPNSCDMIYQNPTTAKYHSYGIMSFMMREYLLIHQVVDRSNLTLVYSVNNENQVIESDISGQGYIYQDDTGEILLDCYSDTDKEYLCTYYLYYAMDEGFREYGAIPISEEQFLQFDHADEILERLAEQFEDYSVEYDFLYRSNHTIHVNVFAKKNGTAKNYYMTLTYDERGVTVKKDLMPGRAKTANMLEIATFPGRFKHPESKRSKKEMEEDYDS